MPQVATFQVTGWQGRMQRAQQKIAMLEADAGTDGNGVVFGGWASQPNNIVTHTDCADTAAADVLRDQYRALSGSVITVVDQFGVNWPFCVVMSISADYSRIIGTNAARVTAFWTFLPESLRPPGIPQ